MNPLSQASSSDLWQAVDATAPLRPPSGLDVSNSKKPLGGSAGAGGDDNALQEAFTDFVGQTLFGSMLASMRETVGKPAYFHGGRTEEVFQKQLDQHIVEDLTESSASTLADPMFNLFQLGRR